jgi:hypothetical protein
MTHTVICECKGLMELEGRTEFQNWGTGEGNTLKEVCEDILSRYPEKRKYFKIDEDGRCSDWGMSLVLCDMVKGGDGNKYGLLYS